MELIKLCIFLLLYIHTKHKPSRTSCTNKEVSVCSALAVVAFGWSLVDRMDYIYRLQGNLIDSQSEISLK